MGSLGEREWSQFSDILGTFVSVGDAIDDRGDADTKTLVTTALNVNYQKFVK
jgi:hypothetical protein